MGNKDSIPIDSYEIKKVKKNKIKIVENKPLSQPLPQPPTNIPNKLYEYNFNNNVPSAQFKTHKSNSQTKIEYKSEPENKKNFSIIERNFSINMPNNQETMVNPYPRNSNYDCIEPKKNFDNLKFTPFNFNDEVDKYKNDINDERDQFEKDEKNRRDKFNKLQKEKEDYLNNQIKNFEDNYNPWDILGLEYNDLNINNIKKAYKKNALKYHPDKAGKKYEGKFQLITQSYIYLLKKSEESDSLNIKLAKKVEKANYEDDINEGVENIYVSKDNFDVNKFNKIFDKYKLPSSFDKGYSDLMKNDNKNSIESDNNSVFGSKFNNDIFNAHFDKKKLNKSSNSIIEYQEPIALETSLSNFSQSMLGIDDIDDFGAINSNGLSYTDYKKAHIDETMLIDINKVKYKSYNSVEQLENDRSNISYVLSPEDRRRQEMMQRKIEEDDNFRIQKQRRHDEMIKSQYDKINHRLIINK